MGPAPASAAPYSAAVAARFPAPSVIYNTPGLQEGRGSFTSNAEIQTWLRELSTAASRSPGLKAAVLPIGQSQRGETLEALVLTRAAGIQMQHSPYKTIVDATGDVFDGRIQMVFDPSFVPYAKAGKVLAALVDHHVGFALGHRPLIVVQDRDWSSLPAEAREEIFEKVVAVAQDVLAWLRRTDRGGTAHERELSKVLEPYQSRSTEVAKS